MSLEDDSTRKKKETGRIDLRMTSGKILTLQGVLHVPTLQKNLISESSLLRAGYRMVKKSNKLVISSLISSLEKVLFVMAFFVSI